MASLGAFSPLVAPYVDGAPGVAIQAAVLQGAIRFCERTLTLQRTLAAVTTVANQADYTLTQSGEVVEKLLGAKLAGVPLAILTPADIDGEQDLTSATASGTPDVILTAPMQVTLRPAPSAAGLSLVVRAAMRPSQTATTLADELLERHGRAIADWAVHLLASQPGKAYSNDKAALARATMFEDAVGAERARVLLNRSRARSKPAVRWC